MNTDYEKLGAFYLGREYDAASGTLKDDLVLYDSKDLTTHAVCVGMTGSGKTGLCLSLLEEAAIDGVPAICIDPKGDLGNLMLNFPNLSAAEFEPWVDAGDAARKGLSVPDLAAKTAETWKNGLAEWGQPPERIARLRAAADVAIYTPGSDAGIPLSVNVRLEPLAGSPTAELWYATGAVSSGTSGPVRYVHDDHYLFAVLELDERAREGVLHAAELAYTAVRRFQQTSGFPHLLRMWNYMDAINEGGGDLERYRQFCVGRARGLAESSVERFPAATAIGRQAPAHDLQVFWLAARRPGRPIENPRQVSAYHYPRVHGPVSPSFSRATMAADGTVLISGTASIVGHASHHHDDAFAQLEETLRNLDALHSQPGQSVSRSLLKVYLRDPALKAPVAARLNEVYPGSEIIFLAADICRSELALEIEMLRLA